jgi:hypothetical protein
VIALALFVIVLWNQITLARILILAVVVAIILVLIQAVIAATRQRPVQAPPAPTGA